jgi:hypothetical protein
MRAQLTRFGGLLVVRQFRDEHNGTLSWAHGFPNGYAGLLNHDLPKFIQVGERFAILLDTPLARLVTADPSIGVIKRDQSAGHERACNPID